MSSAADRVVRSDVAKCVGGAEGAPGSRIGVAHHRRRTVADRVEARDDFPRLLQHPGAGIGLEATLGAELSGIRLERVEGRLLDGRQARVGRDVLVAVIAIEDGLAALEVQVLTGARVVVELPDRLREPFGIDADLCRQTLQGVSHLEVALEGAGEEPVGLLRGLQDRPTGVFLAEVGVEDQIGRNTGLLGRVLLVHRVHHVDVGRGFVDEALAGLVDENAARERLLDHQHARVIFTGHDGGGPPPGIAHQVDRGAQLLAHADRVSGIVLVPAGPLGAGGIGQVLLAHRLVSLEAARSQHNTLPGPDPDRAPLLLGCDTHHAAVFEDQLLRGCVQPEWDVPVHQRTPQHADQRVSHGEISVAPRLETPGQVEPVSGHQLHGDPDPARRPAQHGARLEDGHEDAFHDQHLRILLAHLQEFVPQKAGVEILRLEGAAAGSAARNSLVVVCVLGQRHELGAGLLVEVLRHLRGLLQIGAQAILGDHAGGGFPDVGPGVLGIVFDAHARHQVVVGHPEAAARHGRRAAVEIALLDQQHATTGIVSGEGSGHGARSRADDQ